jgi:hypothetical protein
LRRQHAGRSFVSKKKKSGIKNRYRNGEVDSPKLIAHHAKLIEYQVVADDAKMQRCKDFLKSFYMVMSGGGIRP